MVVRGNDDGMAPEKKTQGGEGCAVGGELGGGIRDLGCLGT